jgi:predicted nucleotidyltransferase
MLKALRERERQRNKALKKAKTYVSKLRTQINVNAAILYGSMARGDFNLGSDIDVLIISDALPAHPLKRMELLYSIIDGGIEPKGYTTSDIKNMLNTNNAMLVDALIHGVVLWDDGTWKRIALRTEKSGNY